VKLRREGGCKQILDDLQEKRGYCNLKEEVGEERGFDEAMVLQVSHSLTVKG